MKFFVAKSGDFETFDGDCLGDYIEFSIRRISCEKSTGRVCVDVTLIHSLIHNDDYTEEAQWIISGKKLFSIVASTIKEDKLHKVTLIKNNLFGCVWVSHKVHHAELPYKFR